MVTQTREKPMLKLPKLIMMAIATMKGAKRILSSLYTPAITKYILSQDIHITTPIRPSSGRTEPHSESPQDCSLALLTAETGMGQKLSRLTLPSVTKVGLGGLGVVGLELEVGEHLVKGVYGDLLVVSVCGSAGPSKLQPLLCYFHHILLIPCVNFGFADDYSTLKSPLFFVIPAEWGTY